MKILFLCKGNVGRSQMAEALFRKSTNNEVEVSSAGTKISGPEQPIGDLMPQVKEVLDVMNEEGLDVSKFIRKQITKKMVTEADKIIVIKEDADDLPDYLLNSPKLIHWNIDDPKEKDIVFTRMVKDQIKERIEEMVKNP